MRYQNITLMVIAYDLKSKRLSRHCAAFPETLMARGLHVERRPYV